ncbi:hypothetical protein E2C01_074010 [Portunus trituberculatus]|uniref:Uncharacterized protein n=1 Tax=Portunus trituberculatus TaxID=210409 RepID=A0A5B7I6X0_PORTR|nr:hypothetical protein [Portunus trituberculatus]
MAVAQPIKNGANPPTRHSSTAAKMWNSVTECCLKIANHFSRRKSVRFTNFVIV